MFFYQNILKKDNLTKKMNGLTLRINGGGSGKGKSTSCSVAAVNFPKEFIDNFGKSDHLQTLTFKSCFHII